VGVVGTLFRRGSLLGRNMNGEQQMQYRQEKPIAVLLYSSERGGRQYRDDMVDEKGKKTKKTEGRGKREIAKGLLNHPGLIFSTGGGGGSRGKQEETEGTRGEKICALKCASNQKPAKKARGKRNWAQPCPCPIVRYSGKAHGRPHSGNGQNRECPIEMRRKKNHRPGQVPIFDAGEGEEQYPRKLAVRLLDLKKKWVIYDVSGAWAAPPANLKG